MKQIQTIWGKDLLESSGTLEGTTVVVLDALAATTNLSNFLTAKPKHLYLASVANILDAIKRFPESIVIGESKEPALKDIFQFSNVPTRLEEGQVFAKMKDKVVIYMTNNGTVVIRSALEKKARQVITASLNNLEVVVDYLQKQSPPSIVVIPCGESSFVNWRTTEDRIVAEVLTELLKGKSINWVEIERRVTEGVFKEYQDNYLNQGYTLENLRQDLKILFRKNASIPYCKLLGDDLGLIEVFDAKNL